MIRRGLARLWLGWVLFYGALTVLAVYLPYRFIVWRWVPPKRFRIGLRLSKWWAKAVLIGAGIRLQVHHRNAYPPEQPYLLIANHRHELDIPISAVAAPVLFRFLAKHSLGRIPLLGWIIDQMYILVDRGNRRSRFQAFLRLKQSIEMGISVLIFPEGRRNRTDSPLLPFEPGAFRLAIDAGIPVIIMAIRGVNARLVRHNGRVVGFFPGTVEVITEMVPSQAHASEQALSTYAHSRMQQLLAEGTLSDA